MKYIENMGGEEQARNSFEKTFIDNQAALDKYIVDDNDIKNMQDNPISEDVLNKSPEKIKLLSRQMAELTDKGYDADSVQYLVAKIEDEHKILFNMVNVRALFMDLGKLYLESKEASASYDSIYGMGFGKFYGNAVLYYCDSKT